MEALLERKLTTSMLVEAGKAAAIKWVKGKTTPKQSLLSAFGAEDHGLVVCCCLVRTARIMQVTLLECCFWLCCCSQMTCKGRPLYHMSKVLNELFVMSQTAVALLVTCMMVQSLLSSS